MNLLQALQAISKNAPQSENAKDIGNDNGNSAPADTQTGGQAARTKPENIKTENERPNVMANVLERHEAISNRIRNKK